MCCLYQIPHRYLHSQAAFFGEKETQKTKSSCATFLTASAKPCPCKQKAPKFWVEFRLSFPLDVFIEWILLDSNRPAQEQIRVGESNYILHKVVMQRIGVCDSVPHWFSDPVSNLWDNQVSLLISVCLFSKFLISQYFTTNNIFSGKRQVGGEKDIFKRTYK